MLLYVFIIENRFCVWIINFKVYFKVVFHKFSEYWSMENMFWVKPQHKQHIHILYKYIETQYIKKGQT